jgi:prolyl oligopeptidase
MEKAGAAFDTWIDAENAYARATLASLAGRAALRSRISDLRRTGNGDAVESVLDVRGGRTLVLDWRLDRPRLGVRDGEGALRVLHDPEAPGPEHGAAVRRAATRLSPDGRYASVGLVERGEANPRLRILDLTAESWLPETLAPPLWADAAGFHVAWHPDSRHLFWIRNPSRTGTTPDGEREFNGHVYVHRLDTTPAADVAIFGTTLQTALRPDDTPYPHVSPDGRWAVVHLRRTAGRAIWVAPLTEGQLAGPFRELLATEGAFAGWGVRDDTLWAIVPDGAPRHRLVRRAIHDSAGPIETVLEGQQGALTGLAIAADGVYFGQRDGAVTSLWRLTNTGAPTPIALPRPGNITRFAVGPDGSGAHLWLRTALQPDEWLAVAPGADRARPVRPAVGGLPPELARYTVSLLEAPARDGVMVPVTLLHARDARREGAGFVRLQAYGCFGSALTPFFDPANLAWLERGGVIAVAHVRGGSEYGQAWHQAAVARGRSTAHEDVVDVAKHLVRDGWTAPGRVAVTGESCGAATVGVAALERPDLIAAAALIVGGIDEWRAWSETPSGARSVFDLGDPTTALGVRRMVAASPYHQLIPGTRRPAFFLFNGGTDYTVPLWMGAKFVARARATAPPGGPPILFWVDRQAGHSGPDDFDAQVDSLADEMAFMFWNLGHPDFQPQEP